MAKGKTDNKDREMAARLKVDPYHNPKAVAARKERRFKEFMRNLK